LVIPRSERLVDCAVGADLAEMHLSKCRLKVKPITLHGVRFLRVCQKRIISECNLLVIDK
jgi:hypothetical protein